MSDAGYQVPAQRHRAALSIARSRFIATLAHAPRVERGLMERTAGRASIEG